MEKLDDVLTRLGEKIQARSEQEAGLTKPKIVRRTSAKYSLNVKTPTSI
jgi:hypothetical protein